MPSSEDGVRLFVLFDSCHSGTGPATRCTAPTDDLTQSKRPQRKRARKKPSTGGAAPLTLRVAAGDIADARASVIVVNHFSGLAPGGAEAAIDAALGGAISRRAALGAFDGHFGATQFLPAATSRLAAGAVLVIGLGEAERFSPERLPEVGAGIVEALATFGFRDAATILHGAGAASVPVVQAAKLLCEGVLSALPDVAGAETLRELAIVEYEAERLSDIERGIGEAQGPAGVHVYVQRDLLPESLGQLRATPPAAAEGPPAHLRIGITRAGAELKVTLIGEEAFDVAAGLEYPVSVADRAPQRVREEVLSPKVSEAQKAMIDVGAQLFEAFLSRADDLSLEDRIAQAPDRAVVLRLDQWTAELPWELLHVDGGFVAQEHVLARQLEINAPGRSSALVPAHDKLRVLVIADPRGDLPGARDEGEVVAEKLRSMPDVELVALIGETPYEIVSRELSGTSFDVLHYAGHAVFAEEDQGAGGFVLAENALLTADDLSTRRYLPRLIFANACRSAAGRGADETAELFKAAQATRNMVAGTLRAGARAFIGSAWTVDDQAAMTFAVRFYEAIVEDGPGESGPTTIGQAVLSARRAVLEHDRHAPAAWAGYTLYGSPWKTAW